MRYFFSYVILFYIILFCNPYIKAQQVDYGLLFKSYEVEKEKRTTLDLTSEEILSLPQYYTIAFDINFQLVEKYPFGYIFRIMDENGDHLDFLLNEIRFSGKQEVLFTYTSTKVFSKTFEEIGLKNNEWFHLELSIDNLKNTIRININDKDFWVPVEKLDLTEVHAVFGQNTYPGFQTSDIPSMCLKDIVIKDEQQNILYSWPLSEYADNGVYDDIKKRFAKCENPDWIINQHIFWKKEMSISTEITPQIAFNPDKSEIAIYDQLCFFRYNLSSKTTSKQKVSNPYPYNVQSNNLIYNPLSKEYNNYILVLDEEKAISVYDTLKNEWSIIVQNQLPPDFWNHNRVISRTDSLLFLFGGYGHHKYKNDLRKFDFKSNIWSKISLTGDIIYPRYLSGLGKIDDRRILLFGGYGSSSGDQEYSSSYFYDLFEIDLKTQVSKKIWKIDQPENNFVVANSLVVDTLNQSFYALAFSSQKFRSRISLLKFSLEKPEFEVLVDSIPFNFEDTKSFVDLYLDTSLNKLIALTSGPKNDINDSVNMVSVYSLSYPPLSIKAVKQEIPSKNSDTFIPFILLIFVFIFSVIIFLYLRRKKNKQIIVIDSKEAEYHNSPVTAPVLRKSSICLFGGFRVIDKDENDITKEFAPMIKQLFIIILLYTSKGGRGISSVKLKDTLWFDKSEESAKNNRGVSLSKLRQIFGLVGDVSILAKDSYWTVEFGENIYCDYFQALFYIDSLQKEEQFDIHNLTRLLSIASTGELLPNLQIDWVDPFKAEFSNNLIDTLLKMSKHLELERYPNLYIDIADTIFIHDSLNEDALRLKCTTLVKMKKNGLAMKVYTSFKKEYNTLFGTTFDYSFEQIINFSD